MSWCGTHSRVHSIQRAAKDGVKILIGLMPVFLLAAFLESYVTRLTEMPLFLKLLIIGLSLAFVVWYYVLFPISIGRAAERGELPLESVPTFS
ncbi:MAG: stage II sporulation protein M [Bacteroidota bacterium]